MTGGGRTRKNGARRLFGGAGEDGTEDGEQEHVGGGERAELRFEGRAFTGKWRVAKTKRAGGLEPFR